MDKNNEFPKNNIMRYYNLWIRITSVTWVCVNERKLLLLFQVLFNISAPWKYEWNFRLFWNVFQWLMPGVYKVKFPQKNATRRYWRYVNIASYYGSVLSGRSKSPYGVLEPHWFNICNKSPHKTGLYIKQTFLLKNLSWCITGYQHY